ncbi:hypothetical protein C7H19_01115 [Aphanothece hegewaldii CCALA 016]|uniref:Uncharacterized protein n=1 Tax=Aphanothece hegewaldii CCALA 016 TaxID=2107694 RepID=A0A2T1M3M2_9CHRO|nr:hypothetical protein [Aphanothece hegewaldii]PSF39418.1 hypothetical protein C7H19_01115 [Aphanothece hegewaldii CCALA 016]
MDNNNTTLTITERIESLKIGCLAAIAFTLTYLITLLIQLNFLTEFNAMGWTQVSIAALSGFLFGVTYRYIVQNQENPHLKDGAVFAFGLVRGLVPLETTDGANEQIIALCFFLGESLLCFAVARWCLDIAFFYGWLKP